MAGLYCKFVGGPYPAPARLCLTENPRTAFRSRQFVNMTRIRIEGLLAAFPKLMGTGNQQHTFIETDSVRCEPKILLVA